ncbi:MAG: hypothetical protein KCHDKBKB_00231 [Elusimicrobia bacterium]|nr:hypothetical protein [Elusimicrobiota bacterium]
MFENIRDLVRSDILWPLAYINGHAPYYKPLTFRRIYIYIIKRCLDVFLSFLMLLLVSPLMFFIALLIKLDSRGPVFYSQLRVGHNRRRGSHLFKMWGQYNRRRRSSYGATFKILKFRSMHVDAEIGNQPQWCQINDPRVTRVGKILRKTHMDELPQLINILRGEMTLVGPRPERPEFVADLATEIPQYPNRLKIKPGLTGLAQIYQSPDHSINDVRRKLRYDRLYAKSISLATDLRIVIGTIPMIFGGHAGRSGKFKASESEVVVSSGRN